MDRLEEIRENAEAGHMIFPEDVLYLLSRVEELEQDAGIFSGKTEAEAWRKARSERSRLYHSQRKLRTRVEELEKERGKYEYWYEQTKKALVEAEIRMEELEKVRDNLTHNLNRVCDISDFQAKQITNAGEEISRLRSKLERRDLQIAEIRNGAEF